MGMSSVLLSAAGAAQATVGSYYESLGTKTALGLEADLADINARLAEGAARDALARGDAEYGISRLKTANLKGEQRAGIAEAGFDLGFGTSAAILTGTDVFGEQDAETIKANAVREAWGHRLEASNLRGQSRVNRASASSINPTLNAAATLLTTGGQVAAQYYGLKQSGALDAKPGRSTDGGYRSPSRSGRSIGGLG